MTNEVVIVLAEDDEGHASLLKKNLRRAGIISEIKHFRDGQETLDFLLKRGTASTEISYLILLDIQMPKVDGVEVLRRIKQHPELCNTPVIMVTTTDDPEIIERCYSIGCSSYINKPVDFNRFVDTIRQFGLFRKW